MQSKQEKAIATLKLKGIMEVVLMKYSWEDVQRVMAQLRKREFDINLKGDK